MQPNQTVIKPHGWQYVARKPCHPLISNLLLLGSPPYYFFFQILFVYFLLYNIVFVLSYINMNLPQVCFKYMKTPSQNALFCWRINCLALFCPSFISFLLLFFWYLLLYCRGEKVMEGKKISNYLSIYWKADTVLAPSTYIYAKLLLSFILKLALPCHWAAQAKRF